MAVDDSVLDEYLSTAKQVARKAGDIIRDAFAKDSAGFDKKTATDPVTETDRLVERTVISDLSASYPDHKFIGEESIGGEIVLSGDPTWIIDPIDGTANFVHRVPYCCVSIGLAVERELVVGVVFNPITDELFEARRGGGARLNGRPIQVSSVSTIAEAMVISEYGSERTPAKRALMESSLNRILEAGPQAIRAFGAAALDMCYVACGRADIYLEYGPWIWDVAASVPIIREAGGVLLHPAGREFDPLSRGVLAANPHLIDALRLDDYSPALIP